VQEIRSFIPKTTRGIHPIKKTNGETKDEGKELHAHIKALMAQMDEAEKNEFFEDASKEGF
jgi:hypothetical protein